MESGSGQHSSDAPAQAGREGSPPLVLVDGSNVAHSSEGERGVLILLVPADRAERLQGGLIARGYRPAVRTLE